MNVQNQIKQLEFRWLESRELILKMVSVEEKKDVEDNEQDRGRCGVEISTSLLIRKSASKTFTVESTASEHTAELFVGEDVLRAGVFLHLLRAIFLSLFFLELMLCALEAQTVIKSSVVGQLFSDCLENENAKTGCSLLTK